MNAIRCSFAAALLLAACTPAQKATALKDGQLFCAKATVAGPLVFALADAAGAPVIVTGLASAVVKGDCAAIDAIPVTPPADPAARYSWRQAISSWLPVM